MDAFGDMLRGVRARGSLFGSSTLSPPWALEFVDGAPLTLCAVLGGGGWIVPAGRAPEQLRVGETVIVRGPAPFTFVDEPGTEAEPVACGAFCSTPEQGGTRHRLGWHDSGDGGPTTLIVGAYPVRGEIGRRLLDALPTVLRAGSGVESDPVLEHLAAEVATDAPGQQVVLDRLLDWLLVCSIRQWFDRPDSAPPAWYAAQRDPVVGTALRVLHAEPAEPWTVSSLAGRAGVSRATFAQALRRPDRPTPAGLPHRVAHDPRRRPPARAAGSDHRRGCPPGRLLRRVRIQRSVQADPRCQSETVPAG